MKKRNILMVVILVVALFSLTGCTIPTDPDTGKYIYITSATTFNSIMQSENWFTAIFVYPLAQLINKWVSGGMNVGVAIALITVIVNAVILLVTFKSNVDQLKMQELQPEITKLQKKYEGKKDETSKMKQAQEMNDIYKTNSVNPFGTILATFIQFPVIIAMYQAVQRAQAVATGNFFGLSLEQSPITGIKAGNYGYIVIFIVMIIMQFLSMRVPSYLTERRAKADAAKHFKKYEKIKSPMQNQMYFMIVFISFLAVSWPTAMTLYWIISSMVNVAKQIFLHNTIHVKEK